MNGGWEHLLMSLLGKKTGSVEKRAVHLVGAVGSDDHGSHVSFFSFFLFFRGNEQKLRLYE